MRSSDWQYLGYVLVAVGSALALSGSVALHYFQQGLLSGTRYGASFAPILLVGIAIAVLGIVAFVRARLKRKYELPPPPPLPPPPLPPPP